MAGTESVSCSQCGAPLKVPAELEVITCAHCDSSLRIKRDRDQVYAESATQRRKRVDELEEEVAELKFKETIETIDRQWTARRDDLMLRGKHGQKMAPSKTMAILMGVGVVAFGVFWMAFVSQINEQFALFGLVFIGLGLFNSIYVFVKANDYQSAYRRYRMQRTHAFDNRSTTNTYHETYEESDSNSPFASPGHPLHFLNNESPVRHEDHHRSEGWGGFFNSGSDWTSDSGGGSDWGGSDSGGGFDSGGGMD
ncbi:Hypothetical protein PBC10988_24020 [Planctomycetales bacterium 10988]|nr:Hypothetical protein PBC10988_24020 [Planctomycetales bacterium 10988]